MAGCGTDALDGEGGRAKSSSEISSPLAFGSAAAGTSDPLRERPARGSKVASAWPTSASLASEASLANWAKGSGGGGVEGAEDPPSGSSAASKGSGASGGGRLGGLLTGVLGGLLPGLLGALLDGDFGGPGCPAAG